MHDFDTTLTAARAGADWAWERLYRDLAPSVTGYVRGQGASEPDDVAGEVFVQVVRDFERFEGGEREFRAWVFTIAHRRAIDDLRKRGRRPVSPQSPDVIAETAGAGGDVHEDATTSLDEQRVKDVIDALPDDQRAVMLLRILGDLTIDDIAQALGKRPGAVKALQRRALKRMEGAYPFADPGR